MTIETASVPRATYGNWIRHRSPGLLGAGLVGTAVLLLGLVVALLALIIIGWKTALFFALVTGGAFTVTGTPLGRTLVRRVAYNRSRSARTHQWRSGMFSFNRNPQFRLPGMLNKTSLLEKVDPFGNTFAVVKNARLGGLYTIVARCTAEGPSMQDQERIDGWVAGWARVLASCGQEAGLVCAKAIIDTAPDPGGRLEAMVLSLRDPRGPALARRVIDECVADYPAASSENVTYVELTFRGRALNHKGNEAMILSELARKVPGLLGQLQIAGGGSVDMVTAEELPRIVRVAYDPASQIHLEQAELAGVPNLVTWADAGPVAAQDFWDHYVHDSGHSVTWEMNTAPRSTITELALRGLLAPHSDFARKRVALVFRPHTPEQSAKVSENDANTAIFTSKQGKKRMSAAASLRVRATEQSRQEVAAGAAMTRFSILVTVTVASGEDLVQAESTLRARAGAVPIRLRRSYGSQAAAFAATLPVGFVPWEHTAVPDKIREAM